MVWQKERMIIAGAASVLACCENSEPMVSSRNISASAATNIAAIITSNVNLRRIVMSVTRPEGSSLAQAGAPRVARARFAA